MAINLDNVSSSDLARNAENRNPPQYDGGDTSFDSFDNLDDFFGCFFLLLFRFDKSAGLVL